MAKKIIFKVSEGDIFSSDGDAFVNSIGNKFELGGAVCAKLLEQFNSDEYNLRKSLKENWEDKNIKDNGELKYGTVICTDGGNSKYTNIYRKLL